MKKLLQILFLIIFCWQFVGVFLHFQTTQQLIKNEAEENIFHSKKLKQITLSINDFNHLKWINKKEFIYNSNYFDLKKITKKSSHYTLICYKDSKEKNLIKQTSEKLSDSKNHKKSTNNHIYHLKFNLIIDYSSVFLAKNNVLRSKKINISNYINNYHYLYSLNISEPPKC